MVHLVVLACVLRATTKKGRQLFLEKKSAPHRKSWLRLWTDLSITSVLTVACHASDGAEFTYCPLYLVAN